MSQTRRSLIHLTVALGLIQGTFTAVAAEEASPGCGTAFPGAGGRPALAVVEKISGHVGFYTAAGARIAGVTLDKHPHEIVASSDGRFLYVSDNGILWLTDPGEGNNTISVIDVARRAKIGVIPLGKYRRPHGMDIDPRTNRLVVTTENPYGLLLIDLARRRVIRAYDTKGPIPHMVLLGPDGEWAFASNTGAATIAAIHLASGKVKLIPTGARPQGGVRSPDGSRMYFVNSDGNSIAVLDPRRQEKLSEFPTGKNPGRIAITPDGKTLVYNLQGDLAVGFADTAAGKQVRVTAIGGRALSLTMSPDGKWAYAGIQDQDRIAVLSVADGKVACWIATPKGAGPDPALPLR